MSGVGEILDQTIDVRELRKISLKPDEVLLIKLGVEGMNKGQIEAYCSNVGSVFRENLPKTRMIVTTVTFDRPLDVEVVLDGEVEDGTTI
jgi:hypothetical protein